METIAAGPSQDGTTVRRWRPTLSASTEVAVLWIEEQVDTHASTVEFSLSDPASPGSWSAAQAIAGEDTAVACDEPYPEDDYMGVTPEAPIGAPASSFVVAWTEFYPCNSGDPHHIAIGSTR
jgi:hypothetical protein